MRIWTLSVPCLLRVLGEVEKQKQLIHNNENLLDKKTDCAPMSGKLAVMWD